MIDTLNQFWDSAFPGTPQLAHQFRTMFFDRWVRFHSLPESKRYAGSEEEYQIILSRHNAVLGDLIGTGKVILVTTRFGGDEKPEGIPKRNDPMLSKLDPDSEYWCTLPIHEIDNDPEFPNYWHIYASEWDWVPGVFDSILRLVADDEQSNVFLFCTHSSWLYHPYDGGADVILPSTQLRDKLQGGYKQWLSAHPEGL